MIAPPQPSTVADGDARDARTGRDVQLALQAVADEFATQGLPVPRLEGKLLRPLVALALVPPALRARLDERFWCGALSLQMVHEASLLHDDILDGAMERRGSPTVHARAGLGAALVLGDHYLTAAYRVAARVGAPEFLDRFIYAVERTVAGEIAQGRAAGGRISPSEYLGMVEGKSGELFGAAAALSGALFDLGDVEARVTFGRDLGALYQRVDDLLDYCPAADTGKPPLQDYRHGKWTWIMDLAGLEGFGLSSDAVLEAVQASGPSRPSPLARAVTLLDRAREDLCRRARLLTPGDTLVGEVLSGWVRTAAAARDAGSTQSARALA